MPEAGHYPQQAPIDAYGNGGFRFADMSHRGSLLCLPAGMLAWSVETAGQLTLESLQPVFDAAAQIDVLLIGLGSDVVALPRPIREALRAESIIVEAIATGGAVRTYNVLLGEGRAVAAALIAVASAG